MYFHRGYPYRVMKGFLEKEGYEMSLRTLKRKLKALSLKKVNNLKERNEEAIRGIIREEMTGPGLLAGYRTIWHALRLRHHVYVPRTLLLAS